MNMFIELTLVLAVTTFVSFCVRALKQPLVVGYILSGIIVGPVLLNILHSHELIEVFSKIGITVLLFIVGLHLSPQVLKEVGSSSVWTGVGQVLFTSFIGFGIALLLGLSQVAALYVAIALTFSSTIIILKLLSDKGDVQTLYGRIAIGMLVVQDVIATLVLIFVSSISQQSGDSLFFVMALVLLKGLAVTLILFVLMKWVLPFVLRIASSSQELLFIFSLSWGLVVAAVFSVIGLSTEIGALLAGVSLSATQYAEEMSSKLKPLRDFFIVLFFVLLGSQVELGSIMAILPQILIFSVFVLMGNPIVVVIIMNLLGFHKKTGFMTGLTVAQISEFSLILATLGFQVGHLSREVLTLITMVGLVTISLSTYLILYSDAIYLRVQSILNFLEIKKNKADKEKREKLPQVLLFGFDRTGTQFIRFFEKMGYVVGVVDFNPAVVEDLQNKHILNFYGDASNAEFLDTLPLDKIQLVITTLPTLESNVILTKILLKKKPSIVVNAFSHSATEAGALYAAGVHYVVIPHHQAATHLASLISKIGFKKTGYKHKQEQHKKQLNSNAQWMFDQV